MLRSTVLLIVILVAGTQGGTFKRFPRSRENRIVNGSPATLGEYPSQLSLQYNQQHNCGASILNADWALTAAHCVYGYATSSLSLVDGLIDLNTITPANRHQASTVIYHGSYNEYDSWKNDIAVIKVSTPFTIGTNVQPIKLPAQGASPADGATATVIGWGRLTEGGSLPNILQKVNIAIVNQQVCNNIYYGTGYPIYSGQICAADGNKGSCNGDSGGPLFVDGTVVGLVSWANGCAKPDYPTVYTRVSSYRTWITQNTGV